jgi:hypothetical protein
MKVNLINEALSRTAEAITNDCLRVYSDYFGRHDAQPYPSPDDSSGTPLPFIPNEAKPYLDSANTSLWQTLHRSGYEIAIEKTDVPRACVTQLTAKKHLITLPIRARGPASLTHELLHVLLCAKQSNISAALAIYGAKSKSFPTLFSKELDLNTGNLLQHTKMLPWFLTLGYPRDQFVSDYSQLTHANLEKEAANCGVQFQVDSEMGVHRLSSIWLFVYSFFRITCSPRLDDYSSALAILREADGSLFDVQTQLREAWNVFQPGRADHKALDFAIAEGYITRMDQWASTTKVWDNVAPDGETFAQYLTRTGPPA